MKPNVFVRALVALVAIVIAAWVVEEKILYANVIAFTVLFLAALGVHAMSRHRTSASS